MKKILFALTLPMAFAGGFSAFADEQFVTDGPYRASWESLKSWECPEWFKDAKFGIWAHWGPQCQPEDGDWYARFMYYPGSGQYNYHLSHYGSPANYGLKEICRDWKAENWNPSELVNLYKSVGAKYFMVLANHHDNLDLWNSPYQEWNTVNIGPKRDIVGEWAEAARNAGLPLGVSVHASHTWTWLEGSQAFDGNLTKEDGYTLNADGTEKWWKGMDPQELYAQRHEHSSGWENSGSIHSQWDWGNGASIPSEAYRKKLMNRTLQLVKDYKPDMIYFDDTATPFYGCDNQWGQDFLASYYNSSASENGGKARVVVTGKQLNDETRGAMLWDVERGIPDRMQPDYWQTCTCIGDWHYNKNTYNNNRYKSAATVIRMLVDIVSKNGNLLLNIPVKGDGTIDDKEREVLAGIKAWMDINGESIYGTRTWKTFGEGPLAEAANPMNAQGFNEGLNYTSADVRFVTRDGKIYATLMAWPQPGEYLVKSLAPISEYYSGDVTSVKLLGYGDVEFKFDSEGLRIFVPDSKPNEIAPVFEIVTDGSTIDDAQRLAYLREAVENFIDGIAGKTSYYNTGRYNSAALPSLKAALEAASEIPADAENSEIIKAIKHLEDSYESFKSSNVNKGGEYSGEFLEDLTASAFVKGKDFSRASSASSRFGRPLDWTVENYSIPQGGNGTKEGLDRYTGKEALSLGLWDDRQNNTSGDLSDARIYRKITLQSGLYFFGASYNTTYNITPQAYMFVADATMKTSEIPQNALAYFPIGDCKEDLAGYYGLYFYLPEEQEVVLGFQADLASGSTQQEFRAERVELLKLSVADRAALSKLRTEADEFAEKIRAAGKLNSNTGSYSPEAYEQLCNAIRNSETAGNADANVIIETYCTLEYAWNQFLDSRKRSSQPTVNFSVDLTARHLAESSDFTEASATGTRFAKPAHWEVENYSIDCGAEGVKQGLDKYEGSYALMLGIWMDRGANSSGNLADARIFKKLRLEPGKYYLGARYNALYRLHEAYFYVMKGNNVATSEIPMASLAYAPIAEAALDKEFHGLEFEIPEEGDYIVGFQADLANGENCQEFRAEALKMLGEDRSGIVTIGYDGRENMPVRYFNLQGVELSAEPESGTYIRIDGNGARKLLR